MELPLSFFNHDAQAGGFFPKSHVGIDVANFGHNQNLLIEGIRGAGKTHILKMVERYCLDNYEEERILPVYVSLAQINEHARCEPDEFRLHLYAHIVQRCVETVMTYKDSLQPDKGMLGKAIESIKKLFNIQTAPSIDDLISDLKKIADNLRFELQYNLTSKSFKDSTGSEYASSDSIKSSVGVSSQFIKSTVESESKCSDKYSSQFEDNTLYVGSKLAHKNASGFLLEFLKQLQILLNLHHSLILLDECSEADMSAQVEIFRLFKSIRGCNSLLADKETCVHFIGSVYPQGGTYYPKRDVDGFSFEPGHDCSLEFLEWDELDQQTYVSFFRDMLLNRIKEVSGYEGNFHQLEKELFESNDCFNLAAYCSNGTPRRFWEILRRGYDRSSQKFHKKGIEIAIQEIANDQILNLNNLKTEDEKFVNEIVDRLSSKNINIRTDNKRHNLIWPQYIYFSINRQYRHLLDRLVVQGAIHDKSRMRMKSKAILKPIYSLDIALAYNFNVIPQNILVKTMIKDIPRCANNGFDQALDVNNVLLLGIFEKSGATKVKPVSIESPTICKDRNENVTTSNTGKIKYFGCAYGIIEVNDGGENAIFYKQNLDTKMIDTLKIGDKVAFDIRPGQKGREASNVELLIQS